MYFGPGPGPGLRKCNVPTAQPESHGSPQGHRPGNVYLSYFTTIQSVVCYVDIRK
jgi:hypothetical protein